MARQSRECLSALVCAILAAASAYPATITVSATNNATIQPVGPRTGSNGKTFFNVEGTNNDTFASYGVADFQIPGGQPAFTAISLELLLTQANASFTTNGALSFYLSSDTATSIDPGTSPLAFPTPVPTLAFSLGPGTFTEVANGAVDEYAFTLSGLAQTYVDNQIAAGGVLRVVIEPADPNVAATWAGYTFNPASAGPELILSNSTAVPEPSSAMLFVIGLASIAGSIRLFRHRHARF